MPADGAATYRTYRIKRVSPPLVIAAAAGLALLAALLGFAVAWSSRGTGSALAAGGRTARPPGPSRRGRRANTTGCT